MNCYVPVPVKDKEKQMLMIFVRKLFELSMDRCTWYTLYETPKGDIKLSLQKGDYGKYFVSLMYYGKINTDAVRSSAIDDL